MNTEGYMNSSEPPNAATAAVPACTAVRELKSLKGLRGRVPFYIRALLREWRFTGFTAATRRLRVALEKSGLPAN